MKRSVDNGSPRILATYTESDVLFTSMHLETADLRTGQEFRTTALEKFLKTADVSLGLKRGPDGKAYNIFDSGQYGYITFTKEVGANAFPSQPDRWEGTNETWATGSTKSEDYVGIMQSVDHQRAESGARERLKRAWPLLEQIGWHDDESMRRDLQVLNDWLRENMRTSWNKDNPEYPQVVAVVDQYKISYDPDVRWKRGEDETDEEFNERIKSARDRAMRDAKEDERDVRRILVSVNTVREK